MTIARPFAVLALATSLLALGLRAIPEEGFESPPKVSASDVLPAELLRGPHHQVADAVTSDGVALGFKITSDFGDFQAPSREMALLRIDEVAAIARLKEIAGSDVFAKALAASVEKKADAVAQVVKDPEGTAKGVGRGLKRLWGKAKKGAEAAKQEDDEKDATEEEKKPSASDVGNELLGVNKGKRQMAKAVGADPYSSNEPLQVELERLARAAVAGGITGSLGVRVPGIDQVASVGNLAWDLPPEDLRARDQKSLQAMGCDEECQKALFGSAAYTPSLRTALVVVLEGLDGVKDRATLVAVAAGAENEVEARFYRSSFALLTAARNDGHALARARAFGRAPAALSSDGTLIVAAAVDLLVWTQGLSDAVARPAKGTQKRELWLAGKLTGRARTELRARGWIVREAVSPG